MRPNFPDVLVRLHPDDPSRITAALPGSFFAKGNARLPRDPARPVQLRACLPHEKKHFDPFGDIPGRAVLIYRLGADFVGAFTVVVDPKCMTDTPENVEAAIADFGTYFPMQAFELRRANSRAAEAAARGAAARPAQAVDLHNSPTSKRAARRARHAQTKKGGPR